MFIEDGFEYHIKIAVEEWLRDHGFDSAEDAIVELDGSRAIRAALERTLFDRAESYLDVNGVIGNVIRDKAKRTNK